MPRISVNKLEPGMKLTKPLTAKNGMVMLAEGTVLTEKWIQRVGDMEVDSVYIDGPKEQTRPKEELLAELDGRFRNVEGKPHMGRIKDLVKQHIERLYE